MALTSEKAKHDPLKPVQFSAQQEKDAALAGFKKPRPEHGGKKEPTLAQKEALLKKRNAWANELIKKAEKGATIRHKADKIEKSFKLAGKKRVKKAK